MRTLNRLSLLSASVIGLAAAGVALPQSVSAQAVVQPLPPREAADLNDALRRLARSPRDLSALLDAGEASVQVGDIDAAIDALNQVARRASGAAAARARFEIAALHQRADRHAEAIEVLRSLVDGGQLGPLDPDARLRLAGSLEATAQRAAARAEYRSILRRYPGSSAADAATKQLESGGR